ncbi:RNA-directed DNA polymerase from mobile element jockey [Trametes pubescens]|uniref:RNA-directed DNA polymerase from mobile element jockey n=1 Tax=Trametes pubescens TaxID=154538 RepID=A0A1M2VLS3_TRAPU|nr:RNA-directed DNA polymerase from mobile element jockey [Trametes pubescens]
MVKVHTSLPILPAAVQKRARTAEGREDADVDTDDADVRAHNSDTLSELRNVIYDNLANAPNERAFWKALGRITFPREPSFYVSAHQLKDVFEPRMNLEPHETHGGPFTTLRALDSVLLDTLPTVTEDRTSTQSFSRPLTVDDIAAVKARLAATGGGKAKGPDGVSYTRVLQIPNEELRILFQSCLDSLDSPQDWLSATLAAIQKKGKDPKDPAGYRNIGLESCLLKTLTLLINRRMREWSDTEGIVPPLQNGFRTGYRTENNVFTLRVAAEQAQSQGKTLWVAFVDLANAFPSVNQSTLWAKLRDLGAGGPLFDWLRMLYTRLRYFVRFNGEYSEYFQALAGILIGDPASPILWNIFFSDFTCPPHEDDVWLDTLRIPYLAHADDIVLLSTSPEGLQSKLNALAAWCTRNGLRVNVSKTFLMVFGCLPRTMPVLSLEGEQLRLTESTTYVGVVLCSTTRNIFALHRALQAMKARRVGNATLALECYIGAIPMNFARKLYSARVDPHLTSGCVVDLDVNTADLRPLEIIQHTFARRVSRLPSHTPAMPVLLDLALRPLRYKRMLAVLVFVERLLTNAPPVPKAAFTCSLRMAAAGHISWAGDLRHALRALPSPVQWDFRQPPTLLRLQQAREHVELSLRNHALLSVMRPVKLALWKWGIIPQFPGRTNSPALNTLFALRPYTTGTRISHRRAVVRLLAGVPPYAIELMRRHNVPRERRICRFCRIRSAVEDEPHILFHCPDAALCKARDTFQRDILLLKPGALYARRRLSDWEFLAAALLDAKIAHIAAEFIHTTFERCKEVPVMMIVSDNVWATVPLAAPPL